MYTTRIWSFVLAISALCAAVSVYVFARSSLPALIAPFHLPVSALVDNSPLFGSAPSFFYTLSIALLIGLLATSRKSANLHCLLWIFLAFCLEWSQHTAAAETIASFTAGSIPGSLWSHFSPYWIHGAFDILDLVATLAGGLIALAAINCLPREHTDETV